MPPGAALPMPPGAALEEPVVVLVGPAPDVSAPVDPEAPLDIPDPDVFAEPAALALPVPAAPSLLSSPDKELELIPDDPDRILPVSDVLQAPSTKTHARGMIHLFI